MKTHLKILIIFAGLLVVSCNQKEKTNNDNNSISEEVVSKSAQSVLIFEKKEHDFGTVDGTDKNKEFVKFNFEFTNKSEKPIIIQKADVSCGCISTRIPDKPIIKGEKGVVEVSVDTKQINGHFKKSVYVKSNAENDVVLLHVKGSVKK